MTLATALNHFNAAKARKQIATGSGSVMDRARQLGNFNALADVPAPKPRQWTVGDVIHGAIGGALGLGFARGVGKTMGLDARTQDKVETIGLGLGAAMNTGYIKSAEAAEESLADQLDRIMDLEPKIASARKDAFKLGFVRAMVEKGHFNEKQTKEAAILPVINLNPSGLLEVPRNIAGGVTRAGELAGTGAGLAGTMDEDDLEIARLNVERAMIEEKEEQLRAERRNAALKALLAKRQDKT